MDVRPVGIHINSAKDTQSVRIQQRKKSSARTSLTKGHLANSAQQTKATLLRDAQLVTRNQEWLRTRALRIEELRAQVRAGIYAVDSTKLAKKILLCEEHNG